MPSSIECLLKREYGARMRYYEEYTDKILNPEAVAPTEIIAQNYHLYKRKGLQKTLRSIKERSPQNLSYG